MTTRRDLLRWGGGVLAGTAVTAWGCQARRAESPSTAVVRTAAAPPDFSVVFLSDPHVFDRLGAARGCALAVDHALSRPRPPELVITGGDLAFDVLKTDQAAADAQYDLFEEALASVSVPIHHTLGNHDVLGLYEESGLSPSSRLFGKRYFMHRFDLERTYYSFDHEQWHFVVLDTIGMVDRSYRGWVDEEQLAWLDDDLAAANRPTVVVGHIPLFSNFFEWRQGTEQAIPAGIAVVNAHQVAAILMRHPVKLVLAGHLHVVESYRFRGIEFANLGAVSGNWWEGPRDGFEEGYSVLEFRGNEVSWRYVDYGWEAVQA